MKTTITHYDSETRKFLASLRAHREDQDRRKVVGHVTVTFQGRQFIRGIREGETTDVAAIQQEVRRAHLKHEAHNA